MPAIPGRPGAPGRPAGPLQIRRDYCIKRIISIFYRSPAGPRADAMPYKIIYDIELHIFFIYQLTGSPFWPGRPGVPPEPRSPRWPATHDPHAGPGKPGRPYVKIHE